MPGLLATAANRLGVLCALLPLLGAGCRWGEPVAVAAVSARPSGSSAPMPAAAPAPAPPRAAPAIARHVIIVSEDGLRPDAIRHAKAPLHTAMMREGAYALRAKTIRRASTLPSHAAMLSGFDVAEHGLHWNSWQPQRGFIKVPTVFTAAAAAGQGAAAFVGKRKLAHIVQPGSVDVFSRPGYFCRKVAAQAARYFTEKRPQLEFIHFSDPDEHGHSDGWMSDQQLAAVATSDRCLATLVNAVKEARMEAETLFIISADHGGHGHDHSGARDEDRRIPWIVWGAGVRPGFRVHRLVSTVDTAATALWALGHAPPEGLAGRPVIEAFRLVPK